MDKGFDTTENCAARGHQIKVAGYDFIARYLSKSSSKAITPGEAQQLTQAGLAVVLVYEDAPTGADYFSAARGQVDGARAAEQANLLGARDGTTIYFAIDYDASEADLAGVINQYFQGVNSALNSFAANGNPRYGVGVYGSGASCMAITGTGLANNGWLAQATGWSGHGAYTNWSISQGMPSQACGLSVDPDTAREDYGAIPAAAAVA